MNKHSKHSKSGKYKMGRVDVKNDIGIYDPEGKNPNPLTGNKYSDKYKDIAKIWSNLPAYKVRDDIIKNIDESQVLLVMFGTGIGKTVIMPKLCLHYLGYKGNVAVTLPKQLIAQESAVFGADSLDVVVGKEVGYKYKGSPSDASSEDTKLLYMTDGTLVSYLMNDITLPKYDIVIMDEVHERKVMIDLLLFLLRQTLEKRPTFKLILMSATVDKELFKNYFKNFKFNTMEMGGKQNYPVESIFLDTRPNNFINVGITTILDILKSHNNNVKNIDPENKDIIFFVQSSNEAFDVCRKINYELDKNRQEYNLSCKDGVFCVEVYSGMNKDKEELAIDKKKYNDGKNYCLKLVIATNVAESSLTIDGVRYVIDSGMELSSSYDPVYGAKKLESKMITMAQAKQRMGRTGRTGPGLCYHLYTSKDFENMKGYPEPDILTSNITSESIKLLCMKEIATVQKLKDMFNEFIEPPKREYLDIALKNLKLLKLIDGSEGTKLGNFVGMVGGDVESTIALTYSKFYNCFNEMLRIMTVLEIARNNIGGLFDAPRKGGSDEYVYKSNMAKYDRVLNKFRNSSSDFLSILNIYNAYEKVSYENKNDHHRIRKWCKDNFLIHKNMEKAVVYTRSSTIKKYINEITPEKLDLIINESILERDVEDRIRYVLSIGYENNIANHVSGDIYKIVRHGREVLAKISNSTFIDKRPKKVLFCELFINDRDTSINILSSV